MRFLFVLSLALSLSAQVARAQEHAGPEAQLDQLRAMMQDARFDEALAEARSLLARTDLSALQRNATLESLAITQLATRDQRGARATLDLLYSRDPEHRMVDRDASPAVQAAFDRARESHPTPLGVTIESAVPASLSERAAPLLRVRLTAGADTVDELRLSYRQGTARDFLRVIMEHGDDPATVQARVPVLEGEDEYTLEWYVEALAPSQAVVGRLGDELTPLSLAVPRAVAPPVVPRAGLDLTGGASDPRSPRDDGGSVLGAWWFWTVVGVVLLGGAASAYLLTRPDEQTPCGTLGCGSL